MVRKLDFGTEACKRQASVYAKYNMTNHEANRHGMAEWHRKMRNGAWEQQNYEDNFGKETENV